MRACGIEESAQRLFADRGPRSTKATEIVVEDFDEVGAFRQPRLYERVGLGRSGDGWVDGGAGWPTARSRRPDAGAPQVRQYRRILTFEALQPRKNLARAEHVDDRGHAQRQRLRERRLRFRGKVHMTVDEPRQQRSSVAFDNFDALRQQVRTADL